MSCGNAHRTSEELKKLQKNIHLHYFLRNCAGYIHWCTQLVHGGIQYASFDTKTVNISQLEVEILGIQDMKEIHNFGDSVTSFILLNCVIQIPTSTEEVLHKYLLFYQYITIGCSSLTIAMMNSEQ